MVVRSTLLSTRRWAVSSSSVAVFRPPLVKARGIFLSATPTCRSHSPSAFQDHTGSAWGNLPIRLMPLGGSITAGVGSSDRHGYRKYLLEMMRSSGCDIRLVGSRSTGTPEPSEHEGWRGFRLDEIEKKARKYVPELKPNVFTINAGSNDCLQGYKIDTYHERMSAMLDFLREASPGSTILLSTLVCNADKETNSHVLRVNDQIRTLVRKEAAARRKIVLADMCTESAPTLDDLVDDGTHPGDVGYRKMAEVWFSSLQEVAAKGFIGNPEG